MMWRVCEVTSSGSSVPVGTGPAGTSGAVGATLSLFPPGCESVSSVGTTGWASPRSKGLPRRRAAVPVWVWLEGEEVVFFLASGVVGLSVIFVSLAVLFGICGVGFCGGRLAAAGGVFMLCALVWLGV